MNLDRFTLMLDSASNETRESAAIIISNCAHDGVLAVTTLSYHSLLWFFCPEELAARFIAIGAMEVLVSRMQTQTIDRNFLNAGFAALKSVAHWKGVLRVFRVNDSHTVRLHLFPSLFCSTRFKSGGIRRT